MITSLENISNETLTQIKNKFETNKNFRVLDDREKISFGKKSEYFLFGSSNSISSDEIEVEFTFIWIGKNLWQFKYTNIYCSHKSYWKNPLDLLNNLLK